MTHDQLMNAWKNNSTGTLKIKHKNMHTVQFYPMSFEESVFYKLNGFLVNIQCDVLIVRETIKIKKDDLVNWEIV